MSRRWLASSLLALSFAACASKPAPAAAPAAVDPGQHTDAVLDHFDQDGDGALSRDEFTHGVISSFHYMDKDRTLSVERHELGSQWNHESTAADHDKDQDISLHEALKAGDRAFEERDANRDGSLSRDEIHASIKKRHQEHKQSVSQ